MSLSLLIMPYIINTGRDTKLVVKSDSCDLGRSDKVIIQGPCVVEMHEQAITGFGVHIILEQEVPE